MEGENIKIKTDITNFNENFNPNIKFYGQPTQERINQVQQMKENPEQYFNFGMTFDDFRCSIKKIIWMRSQRLLIEQEIMNKVPRIREIMEEIIKEKEQQGTYHHPNQEPSRRGTEQFDL